MKFVRIYMSQKETLYVNVDSISTFKAINDEAYEMQLKNGEMYDIRGVPEHASQMDFENFLLRGNGVINYYWQGTKLEITY